MKTTVTLRLVFTRMPAVPGQLVGSTASCLTESLRGQPSVAVRLAEKPHLRGKKPRDRVAKKASFRGRPGSEIEKPKSAAGSQHLVANRSIMVGDTRRQLLRSRLRAPAMV